MIAFFKCRLRFVGAAFNDLLRRDMAYRLPWRRNRFVLSTPRTMRSSEDDALICATPARRIREQGYTNRLIALTGRGEAALEAAARAGFDALVCKPSSAATLLSALRAPEAVPAA